MAPIAGPLAGQAASPFLSAFVIPWNSASGGREPSDFDMVTSDDRSMTRTRDSRRFHPVGDSLGHPGQGALPPCSPRMFDRMLKAAARFDWKGWVAVCWVVFWSVAYLRLAIAPRVLPAVSKFLSSLQ